MIGASLAGAGGLDPASALRSCRATTAVTVRLALALATGSAAAQTISGPVRVIDGDTIAIEGAEDNVRLNYIDAPEILEGNIAGGRDVPGRVEVGESPQLAAAREMQEEIGFDAGELRPLATVSLTPAYSSYRTFIFLAMGLYESPLEGDEPEELETVPWALSDLERLRRRDDFTDARCLLATYLVHQALAHEDG